MFEILFKTCLGKMKRAASTFFFCPLSHKTISNSILISLYALWQNILIEKKKLLRCGGCKSFLLFFFSRLILFLYLSSDTAFLFITFLTSTINKCWRNLGKYINVQLTHSLCTKTFQNAFFFVTWLMKGCKKMSIRRKKKWQLVLSSLPICCNCSCWSSSIERIFYFHKFS